VFAIGLDLGRRQDYTALAVLEVHERPPEKPELHLRYLERYALGTPYARQMDRVATLYRRLQDAARVPAVVPHHTLQGRPPELIVDATGVGEGVVELLKERGVRYRPVQITAGASSTFAGGRYRVPKRELVGRLVGPFESGRLKIAAGLRLVEELTDELLNFKVKVSTAGHESYEAWRESDHDDLVLACSLAAWWVERRRPVGVAPKPPGW
jgi:hypothetical protein